MFHNYTAGITVDTIGQFPVAFLVVKDTNQVALLDTRTPNVPVDFCVYRTHGMTGERNKRDTRKRLKRVIVYGDGTVTGGQIVFTADNARSEPYAFYAPAAYPQERILFIQGSMGLTGYVFDCSLILFGIGLREMEVGFEYTIVG